MTVTTTPRLGLSKPDGNELVHDTPTFIGNNATILDNAAMYVADVFANRGAANSRPAGTLYRSTDTGSFAWTNGTAWIDLVQAGVGIGPLATRTVTANATAVSGQLIVVTAGNPLTVTLPSPALGAQVGVLALAASGTSPVTVSGTNIYGLGLANPASSFLLGTAGARVSLQSDGTNWDIVSGERDTGFVPITLATNIGVGAGYTPASRLVGNKLELCGSPVNNTGANVGNGGSVGTLDATTRPAATLLFAVGQNAGGGTAGPISLQLTAAGALTVVGGAQWVLGGIAIGLDDLSLRAV